MTKIVFQILNLPPNVGEYDLKSFLRSRLRNTAKYRQNVLYKIPSVRNWGDLIFGTKKWASPARFYNEQVEFNKLGFIRLGYFNVSSDEVIEAFDKMLQQAGIKYSKERIK